MANLNERGYMNFSAGNIAILAFLILVAAVFLRQLREKLDLMFKQHPVIGGLIIAAILAVIIYVFFAEETANTLNCFNQKGGIQCLFPVLHNR
ncbi:hypothetical protein FHW67_004036 [Herbaspirillum sp. Sphag1AN]|uniref:hypothetical protein n=1 Tax=unclassified Herbaspirillum TaxID=2624150 RepID=UPI0016130966|nr:MULTISPECIES: hypothetical protein [unclassified Herbaspirillum]MBB3214714.1 hypothetical protein [Herbaspirillum sp. Sphag1AN]MBB3247883.1 hypothetical protein [Herbaspirillum sp. Sphag64]